MTANSLLKAGLLAMANAVLSIPFFIVSSSLAATGDLASVILLASLLVTGLAIFTYLVVMMKKLLNCKFSYHYVDDFIDFIVVISIFFCIARLSRPFLTSWKTAVDSFSLLMLISLGIAQILLGLRLVQAPHTMKGTVKFYGISTIAAGILILSAGLLILGGMSGCIKNSLPAIITTFMMVLLALTAGSIRDVLLGVLFFRFARKIETPDVHSDNCDNPCNK